MIFIQLFSLPFSHLINLFHFHFPQEHLQWWLAGPLTNSRRWPVRQPNHWRRRAAKRRRNQRAYACLRALADSLAGRLAAIAGAPSASDRPAHFYFVFSKKWKKEERCRNGEEEEEMKKRDGEDGTFYFQVLNGFSGLYKWTFKVGLLGYQIKFIQLNFKDEY